MTDNHDADKISKVSAFLFSQAMEDPDLGIYSDRNICFKLANEIYDEFSVGPEGRVAPASGLSLAEDLTFIRQRHPQFFRPEVATPGPKADVVKPELGFHLRPKFGDRAFARLEQANAQRKKGDANDE